VVSKQKKLIRQLQTKLQKLSFLAKTAEMSSNQVAVIIYKNSDSFTRSPEWHELRKLAIEKHGTKCRRCGCLPSKSRPLNIDHILPRKYFPELALDINNLQPLCAPCNKRKGNSY
jgi:5-methylcytosine-specific restriction endonuclease McrA